jgi:hypothetical protein
MIFMEYCNVCEKEIDEPREHIDSKEHKDNLDRLNRLFKDKVYEDDRVGINP